VSSSQVTNSKAVISVAHAISAALNLKLLKYVHCLARCWTLSPICQHKQMTVSYVLCLGGEWDYVIFSTVRSLPSYMIEDNPTLGWCKHNLGFITDRHQINVALTRAKKGIVIIGMYDTINSSSDSII
jgi:hypothetical protein